MATIKIKLEAELEVINKSIKGKNTIESAKVLSDIPPSNSKDDLFKVIKELYLLSKRMLSNIGKTTDKTTTSQITAEDVQSLVRTQLTDVLPGLLKEALENHDCPKEEKKEDEKPSESHTLVIKKIQESEDDKENKITETEWTQVVKKDVKNTLKSVPVIKAQTSNGDVKLHFKSGKDMNQAQEALGLKYKVTSKTQEKKKFDPKLTISDLDPAITSKESLEELLLEKNAFLKDFKDAGEPWKISYLSRNKDDRFAVLQVTVKIREAIRRNNDRIYVDLQQHQVRDRYYVIQCYHCQEYGHTSGSPFCKRKDLKPKCFYCAGPHVSKGCKNKEDKVTGSIKCSNCENSRNRAERNKCTTHKASDTLCPFYVRETERIMARTAGCSEEAKNLYIQKAKALQTRYGRV